MFISFFHSAGSGKRWLDNTLAVCAWTCRFGTRKRITPLRNDTTLDPELVRDLMEKHYSAFVFTFLKITIYGPHQSL